MITTYIYFISIVIRTVQNSRRFQSSCPIEAELQTGDQVQSPSQLLTISNSTFSFLHNVGGEWFDSLADTTRGELPVGFITSLISLFFRALLRLHKADANGGFIQCLSSQCF